MRLLSLLIAAVISVPAVASIDRNVEKKFTVRPGGDLVVETNGGEINVTSSSSNVVEVVAHKHFRAGSEQEADDLEKQLNVTIEQTDQGVSAKAKLEESHSGIFSFFSRSNVWVDFSVSVPKRYNAKLKTSGGSIEVADLDGALKASTSGGSIHLGKIDGVIEAHTSGGSVGLTEGTHEIELSTSGGSIEVGTARGNADLKTSGGGIRVNAAYGTVQGSTSGGSVHVSFSHALSGDSSLSTSGGGIEVKLPSDKGATIDAGTSGGDIDTEGVEIVLESGKVGSSRLKGKVAGGGPELSLHTSGGSIHIKGL